MPKTARILLLALCLNLGLTALARASETIDVPVIELDPTVKPSRQGTSAEVVMRALSFLGIPYRFGGMTRDLGIDCSALVQRVFLEAAGIALPRTTVELAQSGVKVGRSDLKIGDLVFFNTRRRPFSHVGIYLGRDEFLHAPSKGGKVRIEKLSVRYWSHRFNGGRRVLEPTTPLNTAAVAPRTPFDETQDPSVQRTH